VDVLVYFIVPEAEHAITCCFQPLRPLAIADFNLAAAMLRSVNFDDKMGRHTGEIDYIIANWRLSAKMRSMHF